MRVRTAFAVVLISGLACLGVPSAAADELAPIPAETSAVTAPAEEPAAEPTSEPSEMPTSEVTPAEAQESAAPTEEAAEPTSEESPVPEEGTTGEPSDAAGLTPPAEERGETPRVEEGEAPLVPEATVAEETVAAAAEVVRAPRASIGDVNCTNLTVPVTLDNSASTVAVRYGFWAEEADDPWEFILGDTVQVPAGAVYIVTVPVTEDNQVSVYVYDEGRSEVASGDYLFLTIASLTVDCTDDGVPYDPRARIGGVDCVGMAVDVTLDNSRSEVEAFYLVTWEDDFSGSEAGFIVPAGGVQPFLVDVPENWAGSVRVYERVQREEGELLAGIATERFRVDCAPGDEPLASVGEVNCANLTVPVILDNIGVPRAVTFAIGAANFEGEHRYYAKLLDVAAGAKRVVAVPVPNHAEIVVFVGDQYLLENDSVTFDHETFNVNCQRPAAGHAARPTVAVEGAKLPRTGGFNLAVPLLGSALLAGGAGTVAMSRRRPSRVIGSV